MPRLSPITLSLAAIMVAVLSGAVFLLVHARQPRPEPAKDPEVVAAPEPAPPPPPRAPEPLPPPPPAAPAVALVESPAEVDAQAFADDPPPPAPNRRGLLVVNHNRRLQEADENVFTTLALPESTRASIREINDQYRRRTEPGDAAAGGATAASPGDAQVALKARHDALTSLLGTDSAKSFDAEERIAVMKLRGKYRYEWGKQLRQ
jgi:hypothetical protein